MKNWRALAQAALIVIVTAVAYIGSLHGEFVSDDITTVRDNPLIRTLDWSRVVTIFTTFDGPNYMPLKVLSMAVDYQLWGSAPFGFHMTNLIIHILCALVIFVLLLRLELPDWPAFLVALIWAVHPLQVESVAWISERKNVLSGLFFFAAFYLYLDFSETRRMRSYFGVLLLFILALLSKLNMMVLPAVCLAFELAFRHRLRRQDIIASLPLFVAGAAMVWYNLAGNPIHGTHYHGGSAVVTWLSSSVVFFRYLGNLMLPTGLSVFYEVPLRDSLFFPPVFLSVAGLIGITSGTTWCIYKRRQEAFWVLWFGITLAPMLNIIPFRSLMNDRYMYLPMLGPLALAATVLTRLRLSLRARQAAIALSAVAVLACTALTVERVKIWENPLSMWKDWVSGLHYTGADPVYRARNYEAKVTYLRERTARHPELAPVHNNLGALYYESGRLQAAVAQLEVAAKLDPDNPATFLNLGRAYARLGDLARGETHLKRAATLAPYSFLAHLNLARVYLALAEVDGARAALDACRRIRPPSSGSDPFWKRERDLLKRLEAVQATGARAQQ